MLTNTRRVRSAGSALLLAIWLTGCTHGSQYYLDRGNRLYSQGKYEDAALSYRNSIKKTNSAEAHYRLGLAELKQNNGREALSELRRALELAPNRNDVRVALADLALKAYSANPRKPQVLYDQVHNTAAYLLNKDSNSFDGLRLQADVLTIDGRLDEALSVFKKANAAKAEDPDVILPMAQVLFLKNDTAGGEALIQEFLQSHKTFGAAYDVLYNQYIRTNRMADAQSLLRAKVSNLPKESYPLLQLAGFYLRNQRQPEMQQTLQHILNNPKDFPKGHEIVGDFYESSGKFAEAVIEYQQGLQSGAKDANSYRKRMVKSLISEGKRGDAIEQLNLVLKAAPEDLDSRLARAILFLESRDPSKLDFAITELNTIIQVNPNDEVARYHLGLGYLAKGNAKDAHTQLTESARLRRLYVAPRLALAEMAQKGKNYPETIRYADEILAVEPGNADARLWRVAGLIGTKTYNQARAELGALLKDYPNSMSANLHLAVLDTLEKRFQDAEALYFRLYRPGQTDLRPLEGLIQLYSSERQTDKAMKLLQQELKMNPESRPVHLLMAATAIRVGKLDLAITQYEWLKAKDPGAVGTYASLGDVYRLKGDIASSLESYQKARQISPNDPQILAMVAYLESTSGQTQNAIADLQQQLALKPDDTIAMNNLAFALADAGTDLDKAQALAEKAQRKAPNNPGIADTLGWVYTKQGLNDSAAQIFGGLIRKYPNDPGFRYHLGVALLQQGKRTEALIQFDLSLSRKPPREIAEKIKEIVAKIG